MPLQLRLLFLLSLITCQYGIAGTANYAVPAGSNQAAGISQKAVAATQSATNQSRIPQRERWGQPPKSKLLAAIRAGDIDKVKALLNHISNLNRVYEGLTPLMQAVIARQPEITRLLLEHGASPDYVTHGDTPLAAAAYGNDKGMVEILIAAGANVNNGGKTGETPLLDAAVNATDVSLLQDLIAAGADIHAMDADGNDALILAAKNYHADTVKFLASAGLDPCARSRAGKSALDFLQDTGIEWVNVNSKPADWEVEQKAARQQLVQFLQSRCSSR